MSKQKKKKNNRALLSPEKEESAAAARARHQAAFKRNKRYLLPLLANTLLFYGAYAVLSETPVCTAVLWIYFALLIGFSAAYVIYNQGFYRKNITPDMLPDTMTAEEKQAAIDEGKTRLEKSKWMITIIFPLVMTFILDILILFMIEPIIDALGIRF